jgi:hypothetical protein
MASPIGEIRTRISLRPAYGCGCELARKRHAFAVINSRERAQAALSGARLQARDPVEIPGRRICFWQASDDLCESRNAGSALLTHIITSTASRFSKSFEVLPVFILKVFIHCVQTC